MLPGGGFSGIALYFLRKYNAVVFGACLDQNNIVKHTWIDSVDNLVLLQNSKYVQSDMGDSFQKVRDFLLKGRYVVFSGTPCQIAGLKHFLSFHKVGCSDERLITVDIICHGVPSAKLLDYDIRNEFNGFKVMGIKFRKKTSIGKSKSRFALCLKTNHFFTSVLEPSTDLFYNSFLKGMSFRESCYNCLFAEANRIGDFTVGDCDSKAEYTSFHEYESCSTLLCNSSKAMSEWGNGLSSYFDFLMLDYEKEVECNGQLRSPFSRPKERDEIYLDIENLDYKSVKKKYTESSGLIKKVKFYISCNTPQELFAVWANIKRCLLRKCKLNENSNY